MPKRRISREMIMECALELLEEGGLEGLSIRAVGDRLGCTGMALYRHIKDRADSVGVADALLARLVLPEASLPWGEGLEQLLANFLALARKHPGGFEVLHAIPLNHPPEPEGHTRLNLALDTVLREIRIPAARVPQIRRFIVISMMGNAQADLQSMRKLKRNLTPEESAYPFMTKAITRYLQGLAREAQEQVPVS